MAVINSPWVGDARGKLAGGVYFRAKGQTLARGYNPSPLNRRTSPQQTQRALFSSAVRFYTKGVQNLFKFAFEGKATKESDYNAFMRYNAKLGMYFGPEENKNEAFGSLAPWVLTRGSLPGKFVYWDNRTPCLYVSVYSTEPPPVNATVGWLSEQILKDEGYMQGDILTFLRIDSNEQEGSRNYPYANVPSSMPDWYINQFQLDTSDTRTLLSLNISLNYSGGTLNFWMGENGYSGMAEGAAFIHSRMSGGQLLVSDSDLHLNDKGESVWWFGRTDTWLNKVLAAWNAEDKSILQGSRLRAKAAESAVTFVYDFNFPMPSEQLSNRNIYVMGVSDVESVVTHFRFSDGSEPTFYLTLNTETDKLSLTDGSDTFGTATYTEGDGYVIVEFDVISQGPVLYNVLWVNS